MSPKKIAVFARVSIISHGNLNQTTADTSKALYSNKLSEGRQQKVISIMWLRSERCRENKNRGLVQKDRSNCRTASHMLVPLAFCHDPFARLYIPILHLFLIDELIIFFLKNSYYMQYTGPFMAYYSNFSGIILCSGGERIGPMTYAATKVRKVLKESRRGVFDLKTMLAGAWPSNFWKCSVLIIYLLTELNY